MPSDSLHREKDIQSPCKHVVLVKASTAYSAGILRQMNDCTAMSEERFFFLVLTAGEVCCTMDRVVASISLVQLLHLSTRAPARCLHTSAKCHHDTFCV